MSEWVRTGMIIITITDFEKGRKGSNNFAQREDRNNSK